MLAFLSDWISNNCALMPNVARALSHLGTRTGQPGREVREAAPPWPSDTDTGAPPPTPDGFTDHREADMRLTLSLLGLELDVTFGPATAAEDEDQGAALNGGTLAAYPVGFSVWPVPEEITAPQHCPSWDEPEE